MLQRKRKPLAKHASETLKDVVTWRDPWTGGRWTVATIVRGRRMTRPTIEGNEHGRN